MRTYPINYEDFKTKFNTEKKCVDYLYSLRWKDSFSCPRCECNNMWQIYERKYKCKDCGYQTTVTSGTYFQGSHLPLTVWFEAIWHIISQRNETNALELQKYLNLGNNRTALNVLGKIREIMRTCDKDKLQGEIYIDDIALHNKRYSSITNAFIASEIIDENFSRIRLEQIGGLSKQEAFSNFVDKYIEPKSVIHIKKNRFYTKVPDRYELICEPLVTGHRRHPKLYKLFNELKDNNLISNTQRNCNSKSKELCISECCYKYNRRNEEIGLLFNEILYNAVHMKP